MKKSIGKILLVLVPLIIALILLYPTYKASKLEKLKQQYLEQARKAKNPQDSLEIIEKFEKAYGQELLDARANRIKLGLDLRGGMYVTLEVDVLKMLEESAQRDAIDDIFMEVLEKTKQDAKNSDEDVVDIFKRNFDQIARPKKKFLSDYYDFGGSAAESEEDIIKKLKENAQESIDQALQVIRQRVDKYGISEPTIQKIGLRRILLELPGVTNEREMRQLIQTTARLEFKLVRNDENLVAAFYKIDELLKKEKQISKGLPNVPEDTTKTSQELKSADTTKAQSITKDTAQTSNQIDTAKQGEQPDTTDPYAGLSQEEKSKRYLEDHPFTTLFITNFLPPNAERTQYQRDVRFYNASQVPKGEYDFEIFEDVWNKFEAIISRKEVRALLPYDVEILRGAKPNIVKDNKGKEFKIYSFYALKREPELTGEVITDAIATFDPTTNQPIVTMSMNADGADKWARITGANIKKRIAIVLDNLVYSAPVVQQKIVGGNSQITGMSSADEAKLLKIVLKAGAFKAPVQIIEERIVGPSLGEDSIQRGVQSLLIAAILVLLFMMIYYSLAGVYANVAVIINVLLIIGIMAAFQGTLTLPGIAGIILTIGMAVDANVLIYERIREELEKGRSIRSAIDEGYTKALPAILDSNITTFITGLILYFFGTGPIQGFAMTLMIGIITTLFTAILISKALFQITLNLGKTNISFGQPKAVSSL
ncbi:protein translocase subunit SecD [Bacteroidetes/Chlorobi group bacterium Naka2016]|nr:MAG: protein translocase subunit SecD [Bacteroidetes/Chlorobi group bacterium Naka2016]